MSYGMDLDLDLDKMLRTAQVCLSTADIAGWEYELEYESFFSRLKKLFRHEAKADKFRRLNTLELARLTKKHFDEIITVLEEKDRIFERLEELEKENRRLRLEASKVHSGSS